MKNIDDKQNVEVAVLEERVNNVIEKLDNIIDNDLPHIKKEIVGLRLKIAYWSGGVGVLVILTQVILRFLT